MSAISIRNIHKSFGPVQAVRDCSLSIAQGEFAAILGPSGCGKTTLLRLLGGFLTPDQGTIIMGGRDLAQLPPFRRNIGFVFQSYGLFPHLTVAENLAFGLKMRGKYKVDGAKRVRRFLEMVHLSDAHDRMPHQLSGGQQQRVALARALVIEPDLLLLDEPLGALDRKLREAMQVELRALQRSVQVTALLVTHDQEEALTMADRIVVMNGGRIEQVGTPWEIYETPRTRFVADFVGASNCLDGWLGTQCAPGGGAIFEVAGLTFEIRSAMPAGAPQRRSAVIRPEKIIVDADGTSTAHTNTFCGVVTKAIYQGSSTRLEVTVGSTSLVATLTSRGPEAAPNGIQPGQPVTVTIDPSSIRLIDESPVS